MGLGKKLGQLNATTNEQIVMAHMPVSEGGYNAQNISNLNSVPITSQDVTNMHQLAQDARSDYVNLQSNQQNLQKPSVPSGAEYPNQDVSMLVVEKMWRIVCLKKLYAFYSQHSLQNLVNRACRHDYKTLMIQWNLPTLDMAIDLAVLGLYDVVIFGDDSGSMNTEEPTEDMLSRWEILKQVVKTIGFWSSLMDADGVVIRFINSMVEGNGVSNSAEIDGIFRSVRPSGSTPLGEQLDAKIIRKIIIPIIQSQEILRPVLILNITDGVPSNTNFVKQTILDCRNFCAQTKYGENAVAFSFAQIGSDKSASAYLGQLDVDPQIGHLIDSTSEFSIEKKECGPSFTEAVWIIKLMIGAIDPAYDSADEQPTQHTQHTQQHIQQPPPTQPTQYTQPTQHTQQPTQNTQQPTQYTQHTQQQPPPYTQY